MHTRRVLSDASGELAALDILQNAQNIAMDAPLALVFGWTGSTLSALDRTSKAYRERGFHVATVPGRFRPGLSFSIYDAEQLRKELEPLVAELLVGFPRWLRPGGPPIVIHLFSNGGAHGLHFTALNLKRMGQGRGIRFSLVSPRLIILDSSPNIPLVGDSGIVRQLNSTSISALAHFFVPILNFSIPPSAPARLLTLGMATGAVVSASFARLALTLVAPRYISNMGREMLSGLKNPDLNSADRLFLCGDADVICRVDEIRSFAASEGKRLGIEPEIVVFKGTGHVAHAAKWKKEYWQAVDRGLEKAGIAIRQGAKL